MTWISKCLLLLPLETPPVFLPLAIACLTKLDLISCSLEPAHPNPNSHPDIHEAAILFHLRRHSSSPSSNSSRIPVYLTPDSCSLSLLRLWMRKTITSL
ncbi:unnamed protein product [Microthlaspi erraticum]|uniref:Uncharacterized protein n=1 Tax=Microthlaspi erraticum TaxID=1685480 RepID=A0A6D2JSD4_9BRAS|nr:unnamed protein product [Microthlaspi erraticum]